MRWSPGRPRYGFFFFEGNTVTGTHLPRNAPKLAIHFTASRINNFVFQQGGTLPYWHLGVLAYLNDNVPQRWIGGRGAEGLALCAWAAKFPDLIKCDFFLLGYVEDKIYIPPLPANIDGVKDQITFNLHGGPRHAKARLRGIFISA